ncbi:unnamed protein product [Cercospora beticola]|nr:unnamed protein product [Cercospora beticola]
MASPSDSSSGRMKTALVLRRQAPRIDIRQASQMSPLMRMIRLSSERTQHAVVAVLAVVVPTDVAAVAGVLAVTSMPASCAIGRVLRRTSSTTQCCTDTGSVRTR